MNKIDKNKIRDSIQDCNINFLIGSGMSAPYLEILGNIENLLTALDNTKLKNKDKKIIEASLYKKYFDGVISKNIDVLENDDPSKEVLDNYKKFLQLINSILLNRESTIVCKQVNVFTTNIDVFLEKALEDMGLEYNDGFSGRFQPTFNLTNFKKSFFRKSMHYDNTSEIPVFNLLKMHGSLTWEIGEIASKICFSQKLFPVRNIKEKVLPAESIVEVNNTSTIESLIEAAKPLKYRSSIDTFMAAYNKLLIVNPTKEKFKHTLFHQAYYDLLRIYSNELEKENTVLFVMGFSFADEHLRKLTLRAADSNPTLTIYVIARTSGSKERISRLLDLKDVKNSNIKIIAPTSKKSSDGASEADEYEFNLHQINERLFGEILKKIEEQNSSSKVNSDNAL